MLENTTFIRDDVLPSYWANRLQQLLSTYSDFILARATPTSIQIGAGAGDAAAICTIAGNWRFVETTVSRAHPGGAAGIYDIFATCKANNVTNVPDPFTDHTDYSFALAIVAHNATPPIVAGVVDHFRKIGECRWDGARITQVTQLVGVAPPASALSVGDVKPSLAAADHPGWVLMDGRNTLVRADYPADFVASMVALGYVGDGVTTFGVPDGRGRTLIGAVPGRGDRNVTDGGGAETHTLTRQQIPPLSIEGVRDGVDPGWGGGWNFLLRLSGPRSWAVGPDSDGQSSPLHLAGGVAHNNMQPYFVCNWFVFTGEVAGAGGGAGGGGGVGAPNVQGANYTLLRSDAQHVVEMNAAGATVATVPPDTFAVGDVIEVAGMGVGAVSLAAGAGVTIHSTAGAAPALAARYSSLSIRCRAANDFHVVGDIV